MVDGNRVALALGSGGARGYAHIGVVEVLEERGYEVVGVSGTSMGALVGGLHAAGRLPEYAEWVRGLTQRDVLRLLDPSLRAPGALRGDKIMAKVSALLDGVRIEDLPVPFTAVATDLVTRKEVWFQSGPVDVAVRASIALPTVFTPVMLNGRLLADGGMLNPVPLAPLSALSADLTVAVSLTGEPTGASEPRRRTGRAPVRESADPAPVPPGHEREWRDRVRRRLEEMRESEAVRRLAGWRDQGRDEEEDVPPGSAFDPLPPGLGWRDVMQMSLESMQEVVARYRLAGYPPDLLVEVPRDACRTLDFHRGADMIALGRALAEEALAEFGR